MEQKRGTLALKVYFKPLLALPFHWNGLLERGVFMSPFHSNYLLTMEHWNGTTNSILSAPRTDC